MAIKSPGAMYLREQSEAAISNFFSTENGDDIGISRWVHPNQLVPFKDHPFEVKDDPDMESLEQQIVEAGKITNAILVFQNEEKDLEIISGHRRTYIAKKLGWDRVPVTIRKNITREEAAFLMYSENKKRLILPSEIAKSYKVLIDEMNRGRGKRTDLSEEEKGKTTEIVAKKLGVGTNTVERKLRLLYLIPGLLELVDKNEIKRNSGMALLPAVAISYLPENYQQVVLDVYNEHGKLPSHGQANKLLELYNNKELDEMRIRQELMVLKGNQKRSEGVEITNPILLQYKKESKMADAAFQDYIVKAIQFYRQHGEMGAGVAPKVTRQHL